MDLKQQNLGKLQNDLYQGSYYADSKGVKVKHGKGKYYFKNGDIYEGKWKDGKFSLPQKAPKKQADSKVIVFSFYDNEKSAQSLTKYTNKNAEIYTLKESITPNYIEQFPFPEINKTSILKLVFNCHGNKNGTNELGIEKNTAKLVLQKIIDIGIVNISISDHSCYGSIGRAFAEAFQGLSKENKTNNITLNVINSSNNKSVIGGHSRTFCINQEGKVEFRNKRMYYKDISSNSIIDIDPRNYINNDDLINKIPAMKLLSFKNGNIPVYEKKVDSFWSKMKAFFVNLWKNIKSALHNSTQTAVNNQEKKYKIQPQSQGMNINCNTSSQRLYQDNLNKKNEQQLYPTI